MDFLVTSPANRRDSLPQSTLLPASVRQELLAAAQVKDARTRHWLIDEIIDRAKRNHPHFFKR